MNPNVLLGGLLVGGLVAAGAAMVWKGDFTAKPETEVAANASEDGTSLKIDTSSGVGKWLRAISLATGPTQLGGDKRLAKSPQDTVKTEFYGYSIHHPGMMSNSGSLHLAQQVLAGLPVVDPFSAPARIQPLPVSASCAPPPIGAGAKFVSVQIGNTDLDSGIFVYSDQRMAQLLENWVGQKKLRNPRIGDAPKGGDLSGLINVAVTDTTVPLYLVLQNAGAPALWNLQIAPGAQIAEIVLIGRSGQGIVLPDGLTPSVTALQIAADCAPPPARQPAAHWGMNTNALAGTSTANDLEEKANARFTAYDVWFQDAFDRPSEGDTFGAWNASNVLIGAAPATPETRLPYVPMSRMTAYVTPVGNVFGASPEDLESQKSRQLDLVIAASGGDLANLTPEPMERAE